MLLKSSEKERILNKIEHIVFHLKCVIWYARLTINFL